MAELSDDELLAELGVSVEAKKIAARTPREERVIAGFEDIVRFRVEHGRPPQHGEEREIFERLYAVRLDRLRALPECGQLLAPYDVHGLLNVVGAPTSSDTDALDDDALLAELGVTALDNDDITTLKHVASREEKRAAEEIANRTPCADFDKFKPAFNEVKRDLDQGARVTREFQKTAEIKKGEFFIVGGQLAYVAELGDEFVTEYEIEKKVFDENRERLKTLRLAREAAGKPKVP